MPYDVAFSDIRSQIFRRFALFIVVQKTSETREAAENEVGRAKTAITAFAPACWISRNFEGLAYSRTVDSWTNARVVRRNQHRMTSPRRTEGHPLTHYNGVSFNPTRGASFVPHYCGRRSFASEVPDRDDVTMQQSA